MSRQSDPFSDFNPNSHITKNINQDFEAVKKPTSRLVLLLLPARSFPVRSSPLEAGQGNASRENADNPEIGPRRSPLGLALDKPGAQPRPMPGADGHLWVSMGLYGFQWNINHLRWGHRYSCFCCNQATARCFQKYPGAILVFQDLSWGSWIML